MADIFKRQPIELRKPITADMCLIEWGTHVSTATNLTMTYQQPVTRRRTLGVNGKNVAVIFPGQPVGRISIQRLFAEKPNGETSIFDRDGWHPCRPTTIRVTFTGEAAVDGCSVTGGIYTAIGCVATSYSLSAEAEGLTVVDNIEIEFLQLEQSGN